MATGGDLVDIEGLMTGYFKNNVYEAVNAKPSSGRIALLNGATGNMTDRGSTFAAGSRVLSIPGGFTIVDPATPKWTLKNGGRPFHGRFDPTAENQQILPPDEIERQMAAEADTGATQIQPVDEAALAQLSKNERKALLRIRSLR